MSIFAVLGLLIILQVPQAQNAEPVDNAVYGDPEIQCTADSVQVNFKTHNVFDGHVYVKGHYDIPGCRVDGSGDRAASIKIPFTACGVRRERSTDPLGLLVITTLVISFHPMFVTRVDRAYNVQCFYMSADHQVTLNMDVRYEVLEKGPTGATLKYAVVGQDVYHRWVCDSPTKDIYCMTVHSCFVDDGIGKKVLLLDENGCAQDKYLMNNLYYDNDLQGGVNNLVFKFADKPVILFQCQIRLHHKEDAYKCQRTSDVCPWPTRGKRSINETTDSTLFRAKLKLQKENSENFDVFTDPLTVLDIEDQNIFSNEELRKTLKNLEAESATRHAKSHGHMGSGVLCVNSRALGATVALLLLVLMSSSLLTIYFYATRKRLSAKF